MLRFLHFEIGALDRQPRDELLSPFFEVFAETAYAVATWLPRSPIHGNALNSTDTGCRISLSVIRVWHLGNCWLLKKALAEMPCLQMHALKWRTCCEQQII